MALIIFLVSYFLLVRSMKSLISLSLDGERTSEILSRDLPFLPWATDYLWLRLGWTPCAYRFAYLDSPTGVTSCCHP